MAFSGRASRACRLATTGALAVALALVLVPASASAKQTRVPRPAGPAAATSGQTVINLAGQAGNVAVDPDTDTAYTLVSGSTLDVIDLATGSVTATALISAKCCVLAVAVDPDTDTV
jgi:DNA-binding beta-propeller fold protein YncE